MAHPYRRADDVELSKASNDRKEMNKSETNTGLGAKIIAGVLGYGNKRPMSWAKSLIEMKKNYKDPTWSGRIASNLKKMIVKKGFIMSENSLENAVTTLATCGNHVVIGSKGGTLKVFEILSD
jgi:hypothetical protein